MSEEEEKKMRVGQDRPSCDNPLCKAVDEPVTLDQFMKAYTHWRYHRSLGKCSHTLPSLEEVEAICGTCMGRPYVAPISRYGAPSRCPTCGQG